MANKRIYLCLAHMSEDGMEQKYVKEAFDTNWVVPLGPNVNGFEKELEEFVSRYEVRGAGYENTLQERGAGFVRVTSASSVAYINGVSEALFKVGMCLPAGPYVSDDDVRYIVENIKANIIG